MATSTRKQVRLSLLALLVSYLRDGTTDVSNFGSYASEQGVYCFTIASELYPITVLEAGQPPLFSGVTILFAGDRVVPDTYERFWETQIKVQVNVPRTWVGDSVAQQIAQAIDEALLPERVEIYDWLASPATRSGNYLEWTSNPRNDWAFENAANGFDQMALEFSARYKV